MGLFDALGGMLNPETLMSFLEKMLSPTQRAILMQLPKVVSEQMNMAKEPAPKISLVKKEKAVGVLYEFETQGQADKFYDAEMQLQVVLMTVIKEAKQVASA